MLESHARDPPLMQRIQAVIYFSIGSFKLVSGGRFQNFFLGESVSYVRGLNIRGKGFITILGTVLRGVNNQYVLKF